MNKSFSPHKVRLRMPHILLLAFSLLLALASCTQDDPAADEPRMPGIPEQPRGPFERTVLIYMSGENNLSSYISQELVELRQGSKGIGNNALVVYVDDAKTYYDDNRQVVPHLPYVLWIQNGETVDSMTLEADYLSSDPQTMSRILNYTSQYYPAKEYGLVLWGHCSGWIVEDSLSASTTKASASPQTSASLQAPQEGEGTGSRRAFGIDNGQNQSSVVGKWMNLSTLASVLRQWQHLKFIFADCCQFQCIESAYELKDVADYIIGSPAEVPAEGAPYVTLTKGLFEPSEHFYQTIADAYFKQVNQITVSDGELDYISISAQIPISVVKTEHLPQLALQTNAALHSFLPLDAGGYPSMKGLIYYKGDVNKQRESVMYDMNDFLLRYADSQAYLSWKQAYDQVVVYRLYSRNGWMTAGQVSPSVFKYLSDERYGGVSMFVPQNSWNSRYLPYTLYGVNFEGYNASIKHTAWYHAAALADFNGW